MSTFEAAYRKLRHENQPGWGGANFATRMDGWEEIVSDLVSKDCFPSANAELLEVGCGPGDIAAMFAARGYRVSGVDISPTAIEWAYEKFREKGLKGKFLVADVCRMDVLPSASFDGVIDGNCFHCVLGIERALFLREVLRVLRSGGFFLVSSMVGNPREMIEGAFFDPTIRAQVLDGVPFRYMPFEEDFLKEVRSAGFEIIESTLRKNPWWDHLDVLCRKAP